MYVVRNKCTGVSKREKLTRESLGEWEISV